MADAVSSRGLWRVLRPMFPEGAMIRDIVIRAKIDDAVVLEVTMLAEAAATLHAMEEVVKKYKLVPLEDADSVQG